MAAVLPASVSPTVGAAAPAALVCFHCGLDVREPGRYSVRYRGRIEPLCCAGCEAVAQAIVAGGLAAYYEHREGRPGRAVDLVPEALRDASLYDRADIQASFVAPVGPHENEAALVLEGVQCPACMWLNEQHLRKLKGVTAVAIDYTSRRARVRWDTQRLQLSAILRAIAAIGYVAHPYDAARAEEVRERERRTALWQLFVAGLGMMQVMMYAVPVYLAGEGEMTADVEQLMRVAGLLLTIPVVSWSASPFFRGAWRDLRLGRLGMDVPVALGIAIAFAASTWATLRGEGEVWFDSLTMFVFFLLAGRYLELLVRNRATRSVEDLVRAQPLTARHLLDYPRAQHTETIAAAGLAAGDYASVHAGDTAPADGVIVAGATSVDEAALTGESRPVTKRPGDRLIGGTVNLTSAVVMRIERVGADTWLSAVARMVERAGTARPRLVRLADRYASVFVGVILALTVLTALAWWPIDSRQALIAAVAVLIVTCPCALSLATPVALAAAASRLARSGVLVVDPDAIEKLAAVRRAVFDKTGSLTTGVLTLESIELLGALDRARCLALARALERSAAHPMALALRAFVTVEGPDDVSCSAGEIIEQPGAGVQALIDGRRVRIGTAAFARALHGRPAPKVDAPGSEARSVAWLADESGWLARFVFSDPLRADAHDTVAALQRHGLDLAILSGDAPEVVAQAAQTLSIGESAGALRPEDKCEQLAQWQRAGQPIAMVGDGVNDGPVLAQADVSIALASAAPLAQHCATIVLLENRLRAIVDAFDTATRTARIVRQNLGWALAYNIASVPLAALGYVPPWLAGLGMALSSLLVVANSIRLLHPPARGDGRAIA